MAGDCVIIGLVSKGRENEIMEAYIAYLSEILLVKENLKLVKEEAKKYYQSHSMKECSEMGLRLYASEHYPIQEVGIFLLGYSAHEFPWALTFLKERVSQHENWKVQEILAMAFDSHCKIIGYETALPLIEEWLNNDCANVRRAASEGLRVWTSRPYFKDHPDVAIKLLSAHRQDNSLYVRKSIGNALRDISKKHGERVSDELSAWDLSTKEVQQVYKLANRFIESKK